MIIPLPDTTRRACPDRARVLTDQPKMHTSPRARTLSVSGQLLPVYTPADAGGQPIHSSLVKCVQIPTSACARRPDRARVVTENPAELPTSTRPRTRTAPRHLVLVPAPPIPAGAAVRRIMPLLPLEVHAVPTANAVTPHDTLSAAHYVPRTIIYQTMARPVSSAILYETPPLAPSDIIYSTSGTSTLPVLRSPRSPRPARREKIIYHARSAVPTFAPHLDSAHNTFTRAQAEAQQRANQQYYLAQHRPNALAQLLGRAPGRR
ncbi:hypothetical protein B0H17DRAFT_297466 [Mycena rosella]|uniref:Uncharacterized protein n=1 Tax=Mycena rosella TaxID=1033263 RepID=A0AAD7DW21_MYCRO|nr:hypothetical protein B0H17DRAFT_297466 [Mycena rosella]